MVDRALRIAGALAVLATTVGCFNHITGSPPRPPWYGLTNQGKVESESRAHPRADTPREAWERARLAALSRGNECSHLAATHPHPEPSMFSACESEKQAAFRAADEAFARSDPEGWQIELARRSPPR